jgi:hypothetical protein
MEIREASALLSACRVVRKSCKYINLYRGIQNLAMLENWHLVHQILVTATAGTGEAAAALEARTDDEIEASAAAARRDERCESRNSAISVW